MPDKPLAWACPATASWAAPHSNAYKRLNDFFPVDHGRSQSRPALATPRTAQPSAITGDTNHRNRLEKACRGAGIDLIDIGSPNDTHYEIAIAAAKRQKVAAKKPLAMNIKEARSHDRAVENRRPQHGLFNYRRFINRARQATRR